MCWGAKRSKSGGGEKASQEDTLWIVEEVSWVGWGGTLIGPINIKTQACRLSTISWRFQGITFVTGTITQGRIYTVRRYSQDRDRTGPTSSSAGCLWITLRFRQLTAPQRHVNTLPLQRRRRKDTYRENHDRGVCVLSVVVAAAESTERRPRLVVSPTSHHSLRCSMVTTAATRPLDSVHWLPL